MEGERVTGTMALPVIPYVVQTFRMLFGVFDMNFDVPGFKKRQRVAFL